MIAILAAAAFCAGTSVYAQQGPSSLNISGGLFSASGQPIIASNVKFKIELLDKNQTCVLFSEQHTGVDLSNTKGAFSLIIGQGTSMLNNLEGTTAFDSKLFENSGATGAFTGCAGGLTFTAGDTRLIRVSYDLGSGTYTAMTPDVPITSSAYAMVAETLQGKTSSDFIMTNVNTSLLQANVDYIFTNTNYANLKALVDGTSSQYILSAPTAAVGFNGQRLTNLSNPTAAQDAATKSYSDANVAGKGIDVSAVGPGIGGGRTIVWDQVQNKWVTSATGSVGLVAAGNGLTGGNITASGTLSVDVGTTATKILQLDASARIPAVDGSLLTNVNAGFIIGKALSGVAPASQQVLTYNSTTSIWEAATPVLGITALTTDVVASGSGSVVATIQPNAVTAAKINNNGVAVNRLLITDATSGTTVGYATCAVGEVLQWTASGWACKSVSLMLGTSGASAGTYGSATQVSQVSVDAQGRVTAASNVNIAFPVISVAGRTGAVVLTAADITSGLGTAAAQNVGTGVNNVLQFSTAGQLPALDGSLLTNLNVPASQWTTSAAGIYNLGNVGVGMNPQFYSRLQVLGGGPSNYVALSMQQSTTDGTNKVGFIGGARKTNANVPFAELSNWDDGATRMVSIGGGNGFGLPDPTKIRLITATVYDETPGAGVERLTVGTNGNVAINNAAGVNAASKLDVNGNVSIGTYAGVNAAPANGMIVSGSVGIGTTTPNYKLDVAGQINATALSINGVAVGTSSSPWQVNGSSAYYTAGNVGVGTTTPGGTLDVEGGTAAAGNGSNIKLAAQNGQAAGNTNGGNIYLVPGNANGSGTPGSVNISGTTNLTTGWFPTVNNYTGVYPGSASSATAIGIYNGIGNAGGNTGVYASENLWGTQNEATNAVAGTAGFLIASINDVQNTGSGTITSATGVTGQVKNLAGTVTSAYAFQANMQNAGTIGTAYGYYANSILGTTAYDFYGADASAKNYFAGNVGIGTTTPGAKLDVAGTVNASAITINGVAVATGSSPFQLNGANAYYNAGNVGIGTTTPNYKLEVNGTASTGTLTVGGVGTNTYSLTSHTFDATVYSPTSASASGPTGTIPDVFAKNDDSLDSTFALVQLQSANTAGKPQNAYMAAVANSGGAVYTPSLVFGQQTAVNSYAERMRLDQNGNLGVGTTSPGYKLDVAGQINATALSINGVAVGTSSSPWQISGSNTYYNAGNVGIGTISPSQPLDVVGKIQATSQITGSAINVTGTSVPTTGIYRLSNNQLGLSANGTFAMAIDTSGNVGVGTATPGQVLEAAGAVKSNQAFSFSDSHLANSAMLDYGSGMSRIDAFGSDSSHMGTFSVNLFSGNGVSQYIPLTVSGDTLGNNIVGISGKLGIGTPTPTGILDVEGGVAAAGNNGTNINIVAQSGATAGTRNGGNIVLTPGAPDSGFNGQYGNVILTPNTGTSISGSGGYVGIGTAAPQTSLDIYQRMSGGYNPTARPVGPGIGLTNTHGQDNEQVQITFDPQGSTVANPVSYIASYTNLMGTNAGYSSMVFGSRTGAATYAEHLRLDPNGNVGIGTTTPNYSLDVNGTVNASALKINGVAVATGSSPWQISGANTYYNSGNVGVGTATPTSLLHIVGTPSGNGADNVLGRFVRNPTSNEGIGLGFYEPGGGGAPNYGFVRATGNVDLGIGTTNFGNAIQVQNSTGNVGIGTTSPAFALDIEGGSLNTFAKVGNNFPVYLFDPPATDYTGIGFNLYRQNNAGLGTWYYGKTTTSGYAGFIGIQPKGTGAAMEFGFASGTGTSDSVATVTNAMTLGANTAAFSGNLSTSRNSATTYSSSSASANTPFSLNTNSGVYVGNGTAADSTAGYLQFSGLNTNNNSQNSYIGSVAVTGAGYAPAMVFGQSTGTTSYSERMRIDSTGNVGIGTTTPNYNLDVNGTVNATAIKINGVSVGTSSSPWQISGANTYYNLGNVGVGLTAPTTPMHVAYTNTATSFSATSTVENLENLDSTANNYTGLGFKSHGIPTNVVASQYDGANFTGDLVMFSQASGSYLERMRIKGAGGNVGIGTATPNAKLDVAGSANFNVGGSNNVQITTPNGQMGMILNNGTDRADVRFDNSKLTLVAGAGQGIPASTNGLTVTTSGNVGVGTTTPNALLEVSTGTSTTWATSYTLGVASHITPTLNLNINNTSPAAGAYAGYFNFGFGGPVSGTNPSGTIQLVTTENWTTSTLGGRMEFMTTPNGTNTRQVRMAIDQNGNVGIGSTTPNYKLDVNGTVNASALMINGVAVGTSSSPWLLNGSNTYYTAGNVGIGTSTPSVNLDVRQPGAGTAAISIGNTSIGSFGLITHSNGTGLPLQILGGSGDDLVLGANNAEKIRILGNGNVGIGTTTPTSLFSIGAGSVFTVDGTGSATASALNLVRNNADGYSPASAGLPNSNYGILNLNNADGNEALQRFNIRNGSSIVQNAYIGAVSTTGAANYTPAIVFGQTSGSGTNYVERMRIDQNGNVGIGTATPNYKLDVAGTVNASALMINGVAVGTSSSPWLLNGTNTYYNGGNVGIGTNSPAGFGAAGPILHLKGSATKMPEINMDATPAGGDQFVMVSDSPAAWYIRDMTSGNTVFSLSPTGVAQIQSQLGIGTNGSAGNQMDSWWASSNPALTTSISATNPNTTNGNYSGIQFDTKDVGANQISVAAIASVNKSHTTGAVTGDLTFHTNNAGTISEKMRILANGNVGIGTTTPNYKLDVAGTVNASALMINGVAVGTSSSPWQLNGTNTFYNGGNVGIGTSTPVAALSVSGSAAFGTFGAGNTVPPPNSVIIGGKLAIGTTSPSSASYVFDIYSNSTERFTMDSGGNVVMGQLMGGSAGSLTIKGPQPGNAFTVGDHGGAGGTNSNGATTNHADYYINSNYTASASNNSYREIFAEPVIGDTAGSTGNSVYGLYSNPTFNGVSATDTVYGIYSNPVASGGVVAYSAAFMGGNVGIGTSTPLAVLDIATTTSGQSAIIVPRDIAANRPAGVNGMIRYNTNSNKFEAYQSGAWTNLVGGAPTFPLLASPVGTPGAPAYSFTGHANSGMYWDTANTDVAFSYAGTEMGFFDATGFYAQGTLWSGYSSSQVYTPTGASDTPMPALPAPGLIIANGDAGADGEAGYVDIQVNNSAGKTQKAYIAAVSTNGAANYSPAMVFGRQTASNSYAETMRIDKSGNVGIGTATPQSTEQIARASTANSITHANSYLHLGGTESGVNSYRAISFGYTSGVNTYPPAYMGYQEMATTGSNNGDLVFGTRAVTTDSAPSERVRIAASGNVGVGTATPNYKLDVAGTVNASALMVNGVAVGTSSSPWQTSGTSTYYNLGNVGIGTAAPTKALTIETPFGGGWNSAQLKLKETSNAGWDFWGGGALQIGTGGFASMTFNANPSSAAIQMTQPLTGTGGATSGLLLQQSISAAANNDSLIALYINPSFNDAAKTGVAHNGLIVASGNVGIGTTTPGTQLDVAGNVGIPNNSFFMARNTGGVLRSILGMGNDNHTYVFGQTGSDVIAAPGGTETVRFKPNGNVGIGTSTPGNKVYVGIGTTTAGNVSSYPIAIGGIDGSSQSMTLGYDGTYAYMQSWGAKPLYINSQGNNIVTGAGNVGIGTSTPNYKLDVAGTVNASALMINGVAVGTSSSPWQKNGTVAYYTGGNVAIGTTTTPWPLDVRGGNYAANQWFGTQIGTPNGEWKSRFSIISDSTGNARTAIETTDGGSGGVTREAISIAANGNVGIGTATAVSLLNVSASGASAQAFIDSYGSGNNSAFIGRMARGTFGAPTAAQKDDSLNFIGGRGYGTTGFGSSSSAGITVKAAENFTDSAQGAYMTFEGTPTGTTGRSEYMRITAGGNLGIGTPSPSAPMQLGSDLTFSSSWPTIGLNTVPGTNKYLTTNSGSQIAQDYTNNGLGFWTAPSGSAGTTATMTETMLVTGTGKVGIGTVTPNYKLDVNGTINASALMINGVAIGTSSPQWATSGSNIYYSGGNVAVGTTPSNGTFQVGGANPNLWIQGTSSTSQTMVMDSTTAANAPTLTMMRARGGSYPTGNDNLGFLAFQGGFLDAAQVRADADSAFSAGSSPGRLVFSTTPPGSTSLSERMRIDRNGNVGIGTGGPVGILDVRGGTAAAGNASNVNIYAQNAQASGNTFGGNIFLNPGSGNGTGFNGAVAVGTTTPTWNLPVGSLWVTGTSVVGNDAYFSGNTFVLSGKKMAGWSVGSGVIDLDSGSTQNTIDIGFNLGAMNKVMTVKSSGNVGIGTTTPGYPLDVNGIARATSFISTSDRRLKTDIETMPGLDLVTKMRGVKFKWKSNDKDDFGVIAQEMEEVLPQAVETDMYGYKAVKYPNLVAPLIESTKELYGMCKASEEQLKALSAAVADHGRRISSVESDNAELKKQVQRMEDENRQLKERLEAIEKKLQGHP